MPNNAATRYSLALVLEVCSHLTGKVHEGHPLEFTFLISSSLAWRALADTISDAEFFSPRDEQRWEAENTSRMMLANYSIYQIPRVVAFFDRRQVWRNKGLRTGRIAKMAETRNNKGMVGYPFLFHSLWEEVDDWGENDFIFYVQGYQIYVLQGNRNNKCVVPFMRWDTQKDMILDFNNEHRKIKEFIENFFADNVTDGSIVLDTFETISKTPGEGALVVLNLTRIANGYRRSYWEFDDYDIHFAPMDTETWIQNWRKSKELSRCDRDILRSMLRMDGATRIVMLQQDASNEQTSVDVCPRLSIRPIGPGRCMRLDYDQLDRLSRDGKGSRHHSGAALSQHFIDGNQRIKEQHAVIIISADGPITMYPHEFYL